ncbi:MAG: PD40 domain-containing protein [Acidobacteria bacterium]|nr:PD40 domain-containing protein [Acidobacteriota bacterium]
MRLPRPAKSGWTRRGWLASLAWLCPRASAQKGHIFTSQVVRYPDPATEFPVERLTDPEHASYLPYPYARFIAKKGAFFLFAADHGSGLQAFRFELRSGEVRQLTEAKALHKSALNILPEDKAFVYVDGPSLMLSAFGSPHEREVYRIPDGWELGEGFSVSIDGLYAALVEKSGSRSRLQLVGLARGNLTTLVEHEGDLRHPQPRPRRASVLYQRDDTLFLVNYDRQHNVGLCKMVPSPGGAQWSPDGRTVLYLSPKEPLVSLRECTPDTRQDQQVARTTQYINFSRNQDGSVCIAASRSLASPHVLILVRAVRRELTLCEHKASNPAMVAPVFSPTSQRIYFQSDRHGKPAVYSVVIDKFIEKTES